MGRVFDALNLPHESERIGKADVEVCQAGACYGLASFVGGLVAERRIERARGISGIYLPIIEILERVFRGLYRRDDVVQLRTAAIERQLELPRREAAAFRDTP